MELHSASEGKPKVFLYRGIYRYLVTLPTRGPAEVFASRESVLRALDALREAARQERFDVVAYCFLPDRAVLVVRGRDGGSDMRAFLSAFRARSSELLSDRLAGRRLWKKTYLERVLRKGEMTVEVARSVFQIPVKSGLCPSPERYEYSGSFTGLHPVAHMHQASLQTGGRRAFTPKGRPHGGSGKVPFWKRRPRAGAGGSAAGGRGRPFRRPNAGGKS